MSKALSIQFKAAFLIMIFSLNTVVGFACAVGVDMGFNANHPRDEKATEAVVHVHKDGKKHIHQEKKDSHSHDKTNHHDEASSPDKSKDGNCCNDKVRNFEQLDKLIPTAKSIIKPVFFAAFVATYYQIHIPPYTDIVKDVKPFVRSHHPPIPDIRIAIQSFQI
jgi:hypothetical protein